MKLSQKQKYALAWLHHDQSWRTWVTMHVAGTPAISTLESLVRKGLALKRGGNGWPAKYAMLSCAIDLRKEIIANGEH